MQLPFSSLSVNYSSYYRISTRDRAAHTQQNRDSNNHYLRHDSRSPRESPTVCPQPIFMYWVILSNREVDGSRRMLLVGERKTETKPTLAYIVTGAHNLAISANPAFVDV